jgi:hypothetical protein
MKTKLIKTALVATSLASLTPHASASTLLIDFGRHNGNDGNATSNPDANGNFWNNASADSGDFEIPNGLSFGSLVDTTNAATSIEIEATSIWRSNGRNNGGLLAPDDALLGDFAIGTATEDYWFTEAGGSPALGNTSSLTISGLDLSRTYDFRLFGTRNTTSTRITEYVFEGANGPFSASLTTSGENIGNDGAYDGNDDTIISIAGVAPNASGEIDFTLNATEGDFGYLGALEISSVPEPSVGLLGTLLLPFAMRRRRS